MPILTIRYRLPSDPVQPGENVTANPQMGTGLLSVTFTDTSSNTPSSWSWAYKNATVGWTLFAITPNPSFVFLSGIYDINLTATNTEESESEIRTGYITVTVPQSVAGFSATNGTIPLNVSFSDASTGVITSYFWNFGDTAILNAPEFIA